MKNFQFLFLTLFGFVISSCDGNENLSQFYWNQTKCSDPWNTGENDSNEQTKVAITNFLKNKNINVLNVDFDTKSPLDKLCESCGCGTGQRIIVYVEEDDKNTMSDLNFYK